MGPGSGAELQSFGALLRGFRGARGLTQQDLAVRSGLSVYAIGMLERGVRRAPRATTIQFLADALRLDASERAALAVAGAVGPGAGPPAGEAVAASRTLPRDRVSFTGRRREMDRLLAVVAGMTRSAGTVAIGAVEGMAGVGKTAFAVHAAHRLAPAFPDGQLFLDLHAHAAGQRPVAPADALASLLLTTGVAVQALPRDTASRAALWRDRMASSRTLVLLDDAADHEQVRPLLPAAPGCLVLITSRRRLAALEDVELLTLGALPPAEATELLDRLLGSRGQAADGAAVAELVERCGRLPLAIELLAGRLQGHPSWTVRHLLDTVRSAPDRLVELRAGNVAVEGVFDLSYRGLPADLQRLFRRLGLHPGRDIDPYAAAALDASQPGPTRRRLEALHGDHLLDEPRPGRFRLHDLLRDYARSLAERNDGDALTAIDRLCDQYVHAAAAANRHVARRDDPRPPRVDRGAADVPDIRTRERALLWLDAELANLRACFEHAIATGRHARAIQLARAMEPMLRRTGRWEEAIEIHALAAGAARLAGDRQAQAAALDDAAVVQRLTGRYASACGSLAEAMTISRDIGDRRGLADVLHDLGITRSMTDEYPAAIASLTAALRLYRELGNRRGQAHALHDLGRLWARTGDHAGGRAALDEAITLFQAVGDSRGEALVLHELGVLDHRIGDHAGAVSLLTRAVASCRESGDRFAQANALDDLGSVLRAMGEAGSAAAVLLEARSIHRSLHFRLGEAQTLNGLGALMHDLGRHRDAIALHEHALPVARAVTSALEEARAYEGIGRALVLAGDPAKGIDRLRHALETYRRLGVSEADRVRGALAELGGLDPPDAS